MSDNKLEPPVPEKIPFIMEAHGDVRTDNYYWLRDDTRSQPKVIDYLKLENAYTNEWFDNRTDYKSQLLDELTNQVAPSETSFKVKNGDYYYFNEITIDDQLPKYYLSLIHI